jgi:hypothetical protein
MHRKLLQHENSCSGECDERTLKVTLPRAIFSFFPIIIGLSEIVLEVFGVIPQIQHRHFRELSNRRWSFGSISCSMVSISCMPRRIIHDKKEKEGG